jgi:hypothetical protein
VLRNDPGYLDFLIPSEISPHPHKPLRIRGVSLRRAGHSRGLMGQGWFRDRYGSIYQVIVKHFYRAVGDAGAQRAAGEIS